MRFPLVEQLPDPDVSVTPQVRRLLNAIRDLNNQLGSLSASAFLSTAGSGDIPVILWSKEAQADARLAKLVMVESAQLVRRVDADAAQRIEDLASGLMNDAQPQLVIHEAMSVMGGVMKATSIDGPAKGASTIHVGVEARSSATAEAKAISTATVGVRFDQLLDEAASLTVSEPLLDELKSLRDQASEDEVDAPSFLKRAADLAEKLRPFADLSDKLIRLVTSLVQRF